MATQIIKQPNGKYCMFSTAIDLVTYYDMTSQEIVDVLTSRSKKEIEDRVNNIIAKLENGEKPYHQFTMSYKEMIDTIRTAHGNKEAKIIKDKIEKQ